MPVVNVHAAKTNYSKLLEQAHAGAEIILGKAGKPYARMVPLAEPAEPVPRRQPGRLSHLDGALSDAFWDPLPSGWTGE